MRWVGMLIVMIGIWAIVLLLILGVFDLAKLLSHLVFPPRP